MAYNQFPEHPDDSVGAWMLTLFVAGIPVVGFIYMLVLPSVRAARPRSVTSRAPCSSGRSSASSRRS